MLGTLRPEDLENVASNILGSDIHALAGQVVFGVMSSPEDAGTWSESLVALIDKITEPGAHDKGFAEPLGGSSGPGKALRFALVQECMEVFEMIMASVDYTCFLHHRHPDYIQANRNLSAFGHMLCAFVNWKVVRDTMLHRGLQRLFSILEYQDDMSVASVKVAADILQAVEPWMEMNWGYTSLRYLDGYYFRMQEWCQRQIHLSKTREGCSVDVRFSHDILDNIVAPKMQWIFEQRERRAAILPLPAVDVAASEALGRSRVPPLSMESPTTYTQPQTHLPVQQLIKTEREYSSVDDPSFFAFPLLSADYASAAAPVPWTSCLHDRVHNDMLPVNNPSDKFSAAPATNTFHDSSATAAAPAPPAAAGTVPAALKSCIEATAGVNPASCQISVSESNPLDATPANIATSSDSASSCSSESMFVPRSCASSGSSHSNAVDAANSPDSNTSKISSSAAEDTVNSSNSSTSATETPLHANDNVSHSSPRPTHKKKTGPMGYAARSSQAMPATAHGHKHAHTPVQQVSMRNPSAQLDTLSSSHPEGDPASDFVHPLGRHSAEDIAALKEAVSRALQEFMLSHNAADFVESLQVLLSHGNAAGVLQTLLQSASAKLEQLSKPKPFSTRRPRSREALQRHFAEQRDRLFCKGGVIDPLAYDFNQHGPAKGRRSGLGFQIPPSNPGYKLMTRWGWEEGRGLGANLQGRTEPCLPAYQPLDADNAKQGLGEQRYKGILPAPAAAVQLRDLLVNICSGDNALLGEEEVQQGLYAFLTNSAPCATPHAPPLHARALCWVGSLQGALVYKGGLGEQVASDLVFAAARASGGPGSSTTLANNMWSAVGKQRGACQRADEQAQEAKQKEARQLAELRQPRAPTKKTTYVQSAEGKALKIRIKQYGGTPSAAPSSDGRVSWE